jgi:hypothetical protein
LHENDRKTLLIGGIVVLMLGSLGITAGIILSFSQMHTNESAGIGAVGGGLEFAVLGSLADIVGVLSTAAGVILLFLSKRARNS